MTLDLIRPKGQRPNTRESHRWWEERTPQGIGERAWSAARQIDQDTSTRHRHLLIAGNMYGDSMPWATGFTRPVGFVPEIASYNVIQQAVDTFVSEVTQSQVRAEAESIDASWDDYVTCRKLSSAWDHLSRVNKLPDKMPRIVRDGAVYGRGFARGWIDWQSQSVRYDRVAPWQVLYDDRGCVDDDAMPLERYMLRAVPRDVVMRLYAGDHLGLSDVAKRRNRDAINNAGMPSVNVFQSERWNDDLVGLCYAWRIGDDGRYCVAVDGMALEWGDYHHDSFPFADYTPFPSQAGGWGDSPVLRSAVTQANLNHLLTRIRRGQDAHGRIIVTTTGDASAVRSKLHNDVALVLSMPGRGTVGHVAIPSVPGDIYQWVPELVSQIFGQFGISALSANGEIPAGFRSGVAIRRYRELTSRRFVNAERAIGTAVCDLARLSVRGYRELAEQAEDPDDIEVIYHRWGGAHRIPWRDLDLEDDSMRVQPTPVSALSVGPAARTEELQELQQQGYLTAADAVRQMPYPDMDGVRRRLASMDEYLEWVYESTLEDGRQHDPLPELVIAGGSEQAMRMATQYILIAERLGAPSERIDLVRDYVRGLRKLEQRIAQEQAAQQAPPPGQQPGPPPGPMPGAMPDMTGMAGMGGAPPPDMPMPDMGGMPTPEM